MVLASSRSLSGEDKERGLALQLKPFEETSTGAIHLMTGPLGVDGDDGNLLTLPMIPVDVPLVLGGAAVAAGGGTDDTGGVRGGGGV